MILGKWRERGLILELLLFLALTLLSPLTFAANAPKRPPISYQLVGVKGDLKNNIDSYLKSLPNYQLQQLRAVTPAITDAVTKALQAFGYYSPQIELLSRDPKKPEQLTIKVAAGEPVKITQANITLLGEAKSDPAFLQLLENSSLQQGTTFHHGDYENFKSALATIAMARGYFHGQLTEKSVSIDPEKFSAEITLTYDSGIRYHYGAITYQAAAAAQELVAPLITIKEGEPYQAQELATISQDMTATRLFSQADMRPLISEAVGNLVPIQITLIPRTKHELEVGIGYATDNGLRMSANWEKPWVNRYGHKLSSDIKLSAPESEIAFDYQIPVGNPLEDYYSVQSGYQYTNNNDTESSLATFGLHRLKKGYFGWDRDLFIRTEYEDYQQGSSSGKSFLVIPGVSFERLRTRGLGITEWGDRQQLLIELSDSAWGSDSDFIRLWGRSKWLRTLHEDHRFLFRFEQGALLTDDEEAIPPSLRFFTGGDQTVRGYDFESIAPKDSNGELIGAKYTTATSIEYNYRVRGNWLAAIFVDAGTATNEYGSDDIKVGTGVGVRWLTPVGMVRLDLAVGISEEDKPVRLHFALGPEL